MNEIVSEKKCCGCHACFNACPKNAITMQEDNKGFKFPIIDQSKCINCGLCKTICPILNNKEDETKKIEAYACYNKNEVERINSSSGGIFILLAKEILKRKGVVFGAAFDENFNVKHAFVKNEKDLKRFMGSKYTQSTIGDTYKIAKEFLDNDNYVLFTGTPCQIEGLKSYLRKEYEKLYTQDIICHGVPSPKVWNKYLDYQKNKYALKKIKDISFRNKDNGWARFGTKICFDNEEYNKTHNKDLFMRAFLNNICLRDSCYNCSFKKKYRISDITLADFWGIDNIHPELNDDKGISLFIVSSSKGKELFEIIKKQLVYQEVDIEIAIKYNSSMTKSVSHHKNEKEFWENIDTMSFDRIVNKCAPKPNLIKRGISFLKRKIKKLINSR